MGITLQSHSSEQTFDFGKKLASILEPGDLISLTGELGAGKTVFTKGLAKGLGVGENLVSPTFTIIREYEGRLPFYHFDVYRLQSKDLEDLGWEDYFYSTGITVVEWGERIKDKLPADYLQVSFYYGEGKDARKLEISALGAFKNRIEKIKKVLSQ